jgi:ABC-type phosphate transport system substrate-binding protein
MFNNNYMLVTNPIGGVEPTPEAISNGAYPGSRTVYLYVNQRRTPSSAPYFIGWLLEASQFADTPIGVPLDAPQPKAQRKYPLTLPDLKL